MFPKLPCLPVDMPWSLQLRQTVFLSSSVSFTITKIQASTSLNNRCLSLKSGIIHHTTATIIQKIYILYYYYQGIIYALLYCCLCVTTYCISYHIESQNHQGRKRPPRSSRPSTYHQYFPLNCVPQ